MSRTDKTAPYYVKWYYDPSYLEESHDHRFHDCDLPPKPTMNQARSLSWWRPKNKCHWWPSFAFYRSRDARCSCYMCGPDAYESVTRRKRERIEGRRYCRDGWIEEY